MTVVGTVEKIKGNTVVVRTKRPASCEHCPTASVCNKKEIRMNVPNTVDAKIGDTVRVYIENDGSALGVLAYMFNTCGRICSVSSSQLACYFCDRHAYPLLYRASLFQ